MKKNINTDGLDSFFSYVSKAIIIIPVVVVIASLFLKFSSPKNSATPLNNITPTQIPVVQNNTIKFDLKGPIICDNLFIKNKKILFRNKVANYLLNGDCLYSWDEGKLSGEKQCGLSNYVSMAGSYLGSLNINDIVNNNLVKGFIADKNIDLTGVVKSCKREEVKDNSIFEVPEKILFKLKQ